MSFRDPTTGRFITEAHWREITADDTDERGDVGDWDDFSDFDQWDEEDYLGE